MTLTHAASRHVGILFDCIRAQLRALDSGIASVVGDYAELEQAQTATDLLFSKMRHAHGMVYRSRLRPVACTGLGELAIQVGIEAPSQ